MRNIETTAKAIANAIKSSGGKAITQDAAKAAMRELATTSAPEDMADNMAAFLNLSALNQELEKHGVITRERNVPALIVEIKKQLAG